MTKSDLNRESAVMISSAMPSAKYSCSASPLMLWNGSTAMEGLSGNGSGTFGAAMSAEVISDVTSRCQSDGSHITPKAWTERSMFLSVRLPRSSYVAIDDQVAQV